MTDQHLPVVRIRTLRPTDAGHPFPGVLTEITVDGLAWPITDYQIHGASRDCGANCCSR